MLFEKVARPASWVKMYGLIAESASHLHLLCDRYECFIGNEVLSWRVIASQPDICKAIKCKGDILQVR